MKHVEFNIRLQYVTGHQVFDVDKIRLQFKHTLLCNYMSFSLPLMLCLREDGTLYISTSS